MVKMCKVLCLHLFLLFLDSYQLSEWLVVWAVSALVMNHTTQRRSILDYLHSWQFDLHEIRSKIFQQQPFIKSSQLLINVSKNKLALDWVDILFEYMSSFSSYEITQQKWTNNAKNIRSGLLTRPRSIQSESWHVWECPLRWQQEPRWLETSGRRALH